MSEMQKQVMQNRYSTGSVEQGETHVIILLFLLLLHCGKHSIQSLYHSTVHVAAGTNSAT